MHRVGVLETQAQRISDRVDREGWPILPPTLLTLHRTHGADEGTRQIVASLDGQRLCQLLYGQRCTREILPGRHTLRVHNTLFWKTVAFDVEPGGHVHFTVWNRSWGAAFYFYLMFVGPAPLLLGVARGSPEPLTADGLAAADGQEAPAQEAAPEAAPAPRRRRPLGPAM
jgi:hypothetical protein